MQYKLTIPGRNCDHEAPIVAGRLNPEDSQSRRKEPEQDVSRHCKSHGIPMVYNLTASANFGMTALWDMAQHSALWTDCG